MIAVHSSPHGAPTCSAAASAAGSTGVPLWVRLPRFESEKSSTSIMHPLANAAIIGEVRMPWPTTVEGPSDGATAFR